MSGWIALAATQLQSHAHFAAGSPLVAAKQEQPDEKNPPESPPDGIGASPNPRENSPRDPPEKGPPDKSSEFPTYTKFLNQVKGERATKH
jgi:hypothetical protein